MIASGRFLFTGPVVGRVEGYGCFFLSRRPSSFCGDFVYNVVDFQFADVVTSNGFFHLSRATVSL